ncbi:hypothetical protein [Urbifossiella limnaea]|uniref:Uncharacterized protein n=1 Tax=Urbifossiella limnaea TaxID=2528023 RepID=A0A517XZ98_9BACT|nr:hypothetical protein [Urbifossiella limnaea]QDU22788.1 hypothetical protein ETAA1_47760 [Urbifossiella limnaea]
MDFCIVNAAKLMHGQHATTMLVNDHVNARLSNYGSAVKDVCVELVYPSRGKPAGTSRFETEIYRLAASCPRVTFRREQRRIDVRVLCRGVGVRRICGDGHLTRAETAVLAGTVSAALELIRPRIKPADKFDVEAFLTDARDALTGSASALRRYLA